MIFLELVAALPKPRQLYLEEDFPLDGSEEAASAHQCLQALLSRCDAVLDGDNCLELLIPVPAAGQQRDPYDPRCYGSQSVFLVRHCYLLLAFTNGVTSGKVGGTSQIVAMQPHPVQPRCQGVGLRPARSP